MRSLSLASLIGLALSARAWADDKEDLGKAAQKAAALESYAFKTEITVEAPFGNLGNQIPGLEGKYQKDVGTHVRAGDRGEFFRKGDKVFVKNGQGEWQALENFQGGGQGGQEGQQRRRLAAGRMMLRNMKAPHEELKDFEKLLKETQKEEKADKVGDRECAVYGGELSEEGLKASPLGRMAGQFGQFGGGNFEIKGKGRAWVDADGNLVKYQLSTVISGDFNGNAFEATMVRASEITEAGRAKVEVPEGVQKLLNAKPEEPKKEEKKDF
jgi:hypothetical protein